MLIALIVFLPILCGLTAWPLGRRNERARDLFVTAASAVVLALTLMLPVLTPQFRIGGILFGGLTFVTDGFRIVYAIVTAVMWTFTSVFALEYFEHEREGLDRYWMFILITFGATEGVMLSGDLMTSFVFFEILSFTSFTWVIHEETKEAVRAGYTYLFIAVIGGLVLFMGLLMLYHQTGTLAFSELFEAAEAAEDKTMLFAAGCCILFGFGAKAGMFPVHIWLPKAHPVAPSPASALLSGILTKVGIYGILMTTMNVFCENAAFGMVILTLGVITMFLGALLALFSVNLKRTLACSSMSQIGFILTGTGMYTLLSTIESEEGAVIALSGTMLHMVNHSLIKLTLFMAAGVVVMKLHVLTLDDIRGYGRNKPFLKLAFALGALGISGVPLFNGFISKTLLHEGIVEGIHEAAANPALLKCIEWIFLFSGGLTFAYMLKLFLCVFVEKNRDADKQKKYEQEPACMNRKSTAVVAGSSLFMVILGQPFVMTRLAAFMTGKEEILEFRAFTWVNLKGGLISLGIGAAVYLLIVRKVLYRNGSYVNLWPAWLDLENLLYRPLLTRWLPGIFGQAVSILGENKVLKPAARLVLLVVGKAAAVFGENKILGPAARLVRFVGAVLAKALTDSLDALLLVFRGTLFRQKRVLTPVEETMSRLQKFRLVTMETTNSLLQNFSFAMMMTCIGILIILGTIVFLTVML